jgi:hypothetical protein
VWLRYIHLFHELRQQQHQYSVCTYTQKHHMPQSAAILIAYMHIHLYRLASTQSPRQQQRPRTKTTTTTKTTTLPYVDHEHILELARVFNDACATTRRAYPRPSGALRCVIYHAGARAGQLYTPVRLIVWATTSAFVTNVLPIRSRAHCDS